MWIHIWMDDHEFIVQTMNSCTYEFSFSEFMSIWIHMLKSSADSEYVNGWDFGHEFIYEFIFETMNSYTYEFSFSEFISIWIHMLISSADSEYVHDCDSSHEFIYEFIYEFVYESGSQPSLTIWIQRYFH